jgi:hypothetical protein
MVAADAASTYSERVFTHSTNDVHALRAGLVFFVVGRPAKLLDSLRWIDAQRGYALLLLSLYAFA